MSEVPPEEQGAMQLKLVDGAKELIRDELASAIRRRDPLLMAELRNFIRNEILYEHSVRTAIIQVVKDHINR